MSLIFENTLNTRPILENSFKFIYEDSDTILEKIEKVATNIYHTGSLHIESQ